MTTGIRPWAILLLQVVFTTWLGGSLACGQHKPLHEVNPPRLPRASPAIVISGAILVDGRGGEPVPDSLVIVEGGTIRAVGRRADARLPDGAVVINASGKTLMPGFLDPHLHVGEDARRMVSRSLAILRNGVTAARDPGRAIEDYAPVLALEQPLPRLFLTGKHFDQVPHAHPKNAIDIQSSPQAQAQIDKIVSEGGSALKVYYRLPLPLIEATCERADYHQIPVTAHLELIRADAAIRAGVDGLEHVTSCGTAIAEEAAAVEFEQAVDADNAARNSWRFRLWAQVDLDHPRVSKLIDLLAQEQVFLTPTLNVFERRRGDDFDSEAYHVAGFQNMLQFVRMCHAGGVVVLASSHGTPATCKEGWAMQHEMELLAEAGLSPLEVISAATLWPARFFRCQDRLGSIEAGKQADLVLYDGRPHENLSDLWKVERVMQAGHWIE